MISFFLNEHDRVHLYVGCNCNFRYCFLHYVLKMLFSYSFISKILFHLKLQTHVGVSNLLLIYTISDVSIRYLFSIFNTEI